MYIYYTPTVNSETYLIDVEPRHCDWWARRALNESRLTTSWSGYTALGWIGRLFIALIWNTHTHSSSWRISIFSIYKLLLAFIGMNVSFVSHHLWASLQHQLIHTHLVINVTTTRIVLYYLICYMLIWHSLLASAWSHTHTSGHCHCNHPEWRWLCLLWCVCPYLFTTEHILTRAGMLLLSGHFFWCAPLARNHSLIVYIEPTLLDRIQLYRMSILLSITK